MDLNTLPSLQDDCDHYHLAFKAFCDSISISASYDKWTDEEFTPLIISKLAVKPTPDFELRVLAIGSGTGEMDCLMLSKLSQQFPRINYRVVDPSQVFIDLFKERVQSKVHELQGVTFDWRLQTLEQYRETGDSSTFHFINAIHCMYYFKNIEDSLMDLYSRLDPGGILLSMITSEKSQNWKLQNDILALKQSYNDHCSHEIQGCVARHNLHSTQYTLTTTSLDVTECFNEASREGNLLLDFFTHTVNFREVAPEKVLQAVLGCFAKYKNSEDGRVVLSDAWDVVAVYKPKE